jgi:hypothetical protein
VIVRTIISKFKKRNRRMTTQCGFQSNRVFFPVKRTSTTIDKIFLYLIRRSECDEMYF